MDTLRTFIQTWDETGSITAVLEKGLTLPPADEVQSFLAALPETEQDKFKVSLASAMIALETYAVNLEKETAEIKAQINQTVQTAKACLSYNSADKIKRK